MEYVIAIDDDDISNISPQNNHEVICIDDSEEDDDIQILDGKHNSVRFMPFPRLKLVLCPKAFLRHVSFGMLEDG